MNWKINTLKIPLQNLARLRTENIELNLNIKNLSVDTPMLGVHHKRAKELKILHIRDSVFDPSVVFSTDRMSSWGLLGELKIIVDDKLFYFKTDIPELNKAKNLLKYNLDSTKISSKIYMSDTWAMSCVQDSQHIPDSYDPDSDVELEINYDDFDDFDMGEAPEDLITNIMPIDEIDEIHTIGVGTMYVDRRDSHYLTNKISQLENTIMESHSKTITKKVIEHMRHSFGNYDTNFACHTMSAVLCSKIRFNTNEEYMGDKIAMYDVERGNSNYPATYSDVKDPDCESYFPTDIKENAQLRYQRLKETCIMNGLATLRSLLLKPGPVSDPKKACDFLCDTLNISRYEEFQYAGMMRMYAEKFEASVLDIDID
jgi:hypothetical protein